MGLAFTLWQLPSLGAFVFARWLTFAFALCLCRLATQHPHRVAEKPQIVFPVGMLAVPNAHKYHSDGLR